MKGLKIIIVLVFVFIFGFIGVSDVMADCTDKSEQFPIYGSSGFTNGKLYPFLKTGESICGVSGINPINYLRSAGIYVCNSSGGMDFTSCATSTMDMQYKLCSSYKNDKNENEAFCYQTGDYYCDIGSENKNYYQNDYYSDQPYDKNSIAGGQEFCFNNVRKECSPGPNGKGVWTVIQDCGNFSNCYNSLSRDDKYMSTNCKARCTNPLGNLEEKICGVDENNTPIVRWCYFSDSKWHNKSLLDYFKDSNCTQCNDTVTGPDCGNVNIDPDENRCIEIKGEGKVLRGDNGSFICNKNQTKLYQCNTNSQDFKDGQYYSESDDCSKKGLVCGKGDKGTIGCFPEGEVNRHDQSTATSGMIIKTTTNEGFWCGGGHTEIRTAIGCIPITVNGLVEKLLPNIFGIAGGIAFLMMVYGFIMMSTSSGDEKKVQEAQKIVTSAITGLLVSVFALFLYRLIAVDILQIPGF